MNSQTEKRYREKEKQAGRKIKRETDKETKRKNGGEKQTKTMVRIFCVGLQFLRNQVEEKKYSKKWTLQLPQNIIISPNLNKQ